MRGGVPSACNNMSEGLALVQQGGCNDAAPCMQLCSMPESL
jgi:hypothetical protein